MTIKDMPSGEIVVTNLCLWAHVGVLERERLLGQYFLLDFTLWLNLNLSSKNDHLESSADYSIAIEAIQKLCFQLECQTMEYFCDQIMNILEFNYGNLPMEVFIRKCEAPVNGFTGTVGIKQRRNFN